MEVVGKIIQVFPEAHGTSQAGNQWKKREYVLETLETYPKKIFFDFFGDRADQFPLNANQVIVLSFNIESREYNGRWYTSIRGISAREYSQQQQAPQAAYGTPAYGIPPQGYVPAPGAPFQAPAQNFPNMATPPYPGNTSVPPSPGFEQGSNATDDLPF